MAIPIDGISSFSQITTPAAAASEPGGAPDFVQTLESAVRQVNQVQSEASAKVQDLLRGNGEDLHTAMIAVEKADLSFQMMMQVRNKIIQAYQTVSQMQF
ncbi:MAG TPA: flagellar hook-basal body complex protein FliE [Candidatus Aquilonibacter sp.]|nr:flagellar hook-basal body complex protein FliE [Candidatus Aquilonibacter sp.]